MSNQLKMARHVGLAAAKPAKLPTGSDEAGEVGAASNPAKLPTGSDAGLWAFSGELLPTNLSLYMVSAVKRRSDCDPWRAVIEAGVAQGLSAKRIHQDFVSEHRATVGYDRSATSGKSRVSL